MGDKLGVLVVPTRELMIRKMMNAIVLFSLLTAALTAASLAGAQDIGGDWQGTLHPGTVDLRLVLHVSKTADGSYKATLDSVDQGANGIPVSSVVLKDAKLSLGVDAVHGTYEGQVAADGKAITGTWTQNQPLPLEFHRATAPIKTEHKPAKPSDIDGAWSGTLDTGTTKLAVLFQIINTEDGLMAMMDRPDQGMKGMPATSVVRDGSSLRIETKAIGGVYTGKIAVDRTSIDGTWMQSGASLPLLLKPAKP
jgi:hypothetical protein